MATTRTHVWIGFDTTMRSDYSPGIRFYRAAYMQGGLRDGKRVRPSVRHTREF